MKLFNGTFLLRVAVAIILIMHSVPGMLDGGVNNFGGYLDQAGFAPFGVPFAWIVKISHVICAVCLILDKYVLWAGIVTIFILTAGIFMVHLREGWYVVGGGRNGVEFNFLLIVVLLGIILSKPGK